MLGISYQQLIRSVDRHALQNHNGKHIKLFTSKLLSRNTKLKLYQSNRTQTDLRVTNLGNGYGRNEYIQSIWKEDCKENKWTCYRRRMLKNENKLGDEGQREDTVKFITSLWLRWFGQVKRMQNQRMIKKIVTATVEVIRKKRLYKRLGDKVEEYLNMMRIKNKQVWLETFRNGGTYIGSQGL